jgi:sucrose-6-phosphate hydrolase SacC (GH32 family)
VASQLEAPKLITDRAGVASQPGADADGAGVASQTAIKQGWHRNWERRNQTPTEQEWQGRSQRSRSGKLDGDQAGVALQLGVP